MSGRPTGLRKHIAVPLPNAMQFRNAKAPPLDVVESDADPVRLRKWIGTPLMDVPVIATLRRFPRGMSLSCPEPQLIE